MLDFLNLGVETKYSVIATFFIILFFTVLFHSWFFITRKNFLTPLIDRVHSWWIIYLFVTLTISFNRIFIYIAFLLVSFIAFRELTSKLDLNIKHRRTLLLAYFSIPVQYYLSYRQLFLPFLTFIPVGMLLLLPFRSIIEDVPEDSIKIFSQLQWSLMICVFSLSHITYIASLPNIENLPEGPEGMIYFLILITQLNDVSQFIFGKLFGKRKISPTISPNKTLAGLIGGIIGSMLFGYLFRNLLPTNLNQTLFTSAILSLSGFFGDLNISAIKRDLKIKDMSELIPGHGGILDRIDSLIFSNLIFFYLIYYWLY